VLQLLIDWQHNIQQASTLLSSEKFMRHQATIINTEGQTMTEAKIREILVALEFNEGVYPREAVEAAIAHKEEITPYLIDILESVLADPAKYLDEPRYFAHIYAVMLLAHFKKQQVHQLIVDVYSLPEEFVSPLFEDTITEDLPMLLYRTCGGSAEQIKGLVLNKEAYDFCRSSALRALNFAVIGGIVSREKMLNFYGSLFTGAEAEPGSDFWSFVASAVYELYPEELMDVIKQAYQNDLIWSGYIGLDTFEQALKQGKQQTLAEIRADMERSLLEDVHEHMSWWACFDQPQKTRPQAVPVVKLDQQPSFSTKPQANQKSRKPKRNDPCWYGSGKKYKHRHLKSDRQNL
jgi:hypothetical protein